MKLLIGLILFLMLLLVNIASAHSECPYETHAIKVACSLPNEFIKNDFLCLDESCTFNMTHDSFSNLDVYYIEIPGLEKSSDIHYTVTSETNNPNYIISSNVYESDINGLEITSILGEICDEKVDAQLTMVIDEWLTKYHQNHSTTGQLIIAPNNVDIEPNNINCWETKQENIGDWNYYVEEISNSCSIIMQGECATFEEKESDSDSIIILVIILSVLIVGIYLFIK